jgi:hypothetical protein
MNAVALQFDIPSFHALEERAREFAVRVVQCPKGFSWCGQRTGSGYFPTKPAALRDAFECGELGE